MLSENIYCTISLSLNKIMVLQEIEQKNIYACPLLSTYGNNVSWQGVCFLIEYLAYLYIIKIFSGIQCTIKSSVKNFPLLRQHNTCIYIFLKITKCVNKYTHFLRKLILCSAAINTYVRRHNSVIVVVSTLQSLLNLLFI